MERDGIRNPMPDHLICVASEDGETGALGILRICALGYSELHRAPESGGPFAAKSAWVTDPRWRPSECHRASAR
jgi:hypothetical protein